MSKPLQPAEKVSRSLQRLKLELVLKPNLSTDEQVLLWKINSCLFSEYPHG